MFILKSKSSPEMNTITKVIGFAMLLTTIHAQAIIDIEESRAEESNKEINNKIGVSLSGKEGNSNNVNLSSYYKLSWGENNEDNILLAEQTFSKSNGNTSSLDFLFHIRKTYHLDDKNAFEYYGQLQTDEIRGLKNRGLIGINLRIKRFLMQNTATNYFGAGVFYFKQLYVENLENGTRKLKGLRANLYWNHKRTLSNGVNLSTTLYIQPKLNDLNDTDILAISTATVPLSHLLSLEASIQYSLLNTKPENFKKNDVRYFTGLTFLF